LNSLSTITAPNSTLTELKLEIASEISINVFQYIMDKFENLKNLRLIVHTVLPDDALGASGNKSVLNIFFNQYCRKLDRLNVSFMYDNLPTHIDRGKIRALPILVDMFFNDGAYDDMWPSELEDLNDDMWPSELGRSQ
jgi:hypothetical protein